MLLDILMTSFAVDNISKGRILLTNDCWYIMQRTEVASGARSSMSFVNPNQARSIAGAPFLQTEHKFCPFVVFSNGELKRISS